MSVSFSMTFLAGNLGRPGHVGPGATRGRLLKKKIGKKMDFHEIATKYCKILLFRKIIISIIDVFRQRYFDIISYLHSAGKHY